MVTNKLQFLSFHSIGIQFWYIFFLFILLHLKMFSIRTTYRIWKNCPSGGLKETLLASQQSQLDSGMRIVRGSAIFRVFCGRQGRFWEQCKFEEFFVGGRGGGKNTFWMSGLPMFGSKITQLNAEMAPECTTEHLFFLIFLGEGPQTPRPNKRLRRL